MIDDRKNLSTLMNWLFTPLHNLTPSQMSLFEAIDKLWPEKVLHVYIISLFEFNVVDLKLFCTTKVSF